MNVAPSQSNQVSRNDALSNIRSIRTAVREHRDQIGDYRCWVDDEVLYYRLLPELQGKSPSVPSPNDFLNLCEAYFNNRQDPKEPLRSIPLDSSVGPLKLSYDESLDTDLEKISDERLQKDIVDWYNQLREHRDRGLNRTYHDDLKLYLRLPEKTLPVTQLPPRELFLGRGCPAYNKHCQGHPDEFIEAVWNKD